jgi:hypothetical protein
MLFSGVSTTTLYNAATHRFSICTAHVNEQPYLYSYRVDEKDFVKIISVQLADILKIVFIHFRHNETSPRKH